MPMRASGINSGLDTDAIVKELMSAYSKKTEKYEKEQTKISWKQEIWKNLNTKVNAFYKSVGDMRLTSAYSLRKVTSSDATKASVTASSGAINGTQKLHVLSTAQSCYLTGGKLKHQTYNTSYDGINGQSKYIAQSGEITAKTTLKELGYYSEESSASFLVHYTDEAKAGTDDEYKKVTLNADSTIQEAIAELQKAGVNASFDEKNGRIFVSSKESGKSSDFELVAAKYDYLPVVKRDAAGNPVTDDEGNTVYETVKKGDVETIKYAWQDISSESSVYTDRIKSSKNLLNVLGLNTDPTADDISDGVDKATRLGGNDAEIVLNGVLFTAKENSFSINGLNINVNGVTDKRDDCLRDDGSLDLTKLKDDNAITINIATDTQGIYDKIKDFLTSYNNIINEITKMYNADSAKDYEPLTDEEKDAMSDTEIEKWETKIKDSLLRRDNSLGALMNGMMTAMSQGITINGKNYALSSFGIHTMGYLNAVKNEQNAYHIDGDEDDANTSDNEDKLMAAISSDPETVVEFMKQLSTNLYSAIDKQMQSSDLRTRYCIYNDKELDKQYANYTKIIKEWEQKVSDKEDYYYKKFSQMETALAKMNSQTSSISSMLGS